VALDITGLADEISAIVNLPWAIPLEEWDEEEALTGRRGLSRHVVRLASTSEGLFAVKETLPELAHREYRLLRELDKVGAPAVDPVAVIDGRVDIHGEPLPAAIVTRYLPFSLPYRVVLTRTVTSHDVETMANALSLLLVRLHLLGFWWGDCSLSNALFRRDAGGFAAYLVDAETGELHPKLTNGQREHDLDIAEFNVAAELEDLQLSGAMHFALDPVRAAEAVVRRYRRLWKELNEPKFLDPRDEHAVEKAMRSLQNLGFDIEEVLVTVDGEDRLRYEPRLVAAGHHVHRLERLMGLHTEESQARRILAAFDRYRAREPSPRRSEEESARAWYNEKFLPVVERIPDDLRLRLEPAQVFHEVLEHKWFLSERLGTDVGIDRAVETYFAEVLPRRPEEGRPQLAQ
jgi:hypothetical protein